MKKVLWLLAPMNYNNQVLQLTRESVKGHEAICYVTLNKTASALSGLFKEHKIPVEKFHFVDVITPKVLGRRAPEGSIFVDSMAEPSAFVEQILNLIRLQKIDLIIFDSVSSYLIYQSDANLVVFFNYLISFLEALNVDIILFSLIEDAERPALKQIKMRVDSTEVR